MSTPYPLRNDTTARAVHPMVAAAASKQDFSYASDYLGCNVRVTYEPLEPADFQFGRIGPGIEVTGIYLTLEGGAEFDFGLHAEKMTHRAVDMEAEREWAKRGGK